MIKQVKKTLQQLSNVLIVAEKQVTDQNGVVIAVTNYRSINMTEKCTKCQEVLWFYAEDAARGKVIKVCKNPKCTMYNFKVSFSER